ncbi:SDR family NAD(P)-dependent oxidoreductase [Candidatus Poribacteria bacterium]|nr:SDR family NAD(P)-dependent oxidoreductase [Candidatus Poribacteria bacterium]
MSELRGKNALITGGGRGIGRAIALAFCEKGCNVAVTARSTDEIESVAQEICSIGPKGICIKADVSNEQEAKNTVLKVQEELGSIDIFVNNAGVFICKPFTELTMDDWDRTMSVNLRGAFIWARQVAKVMMKQKSGIIINMCSSASRKAYVDQMAYVASKHGLLGLSRCLNLELKPYGIKVHAICPGGVDTRLTADARPDADRSEWMQPKDIAHVAVMLATQSNRASIDEIYIRRYDATPIY